MYSQEYLDYLIHFHIHRDYFECHEVLEEYWKKEQKQDIVWVGLIQIAVSLYHQRRSNFQGASRMMSSAIRIMENTKDKLIHLGLEADRLISLLHIRQLELSEQKPYSSFDLPLTKELVTQCKHYCQENQMEWCSNKNIQDEFIINKHTLRDRSDVKRERELSKQQKEPRYE